MGIWKPPPPAAQLDGTMRTEPQMGPRQAARQLKTGGDFRVHDSGPRVHLQSPAML